MDYSTTNSDIASNRVEAIAIDEDKEIYLGALPLEEMGYKGWIDRHQFVVLSIVESFEEKMTTIVGKCIQFDRTKEQLDIDTPEFRALSVDEKVD